MQDAIWEISNRIGNNWTTIYMKLPFMPERTQEKRAEDIKSKSILFFHIMDSLKIGRAWAKNLRMKISNKTDHMMISLIIFMLPTPSE